MECMDAYYVPAWALRLEFRTARHYWSTQQQHLHPTDTTCVAAAVLEYTA
jgi:hypothetical protein